MSNVVTFKPRPSPPPEAVERVRKAYAMIQEANELLAEAAEICDAAGIPRDRNGVPMVGPTPPTGAA